MQTIRTTKAREKFLEALAETCNVTKACAAARISRVAAYDWRLDDPDFAKAWEDARLIGAEALEDEATRRAHDGVEEPVYQGGRLVGAVRKFSDTLLIFLLKGAKPEKYRERVSNEVTGRNGDPLQMVTTYQLPSNGRDVL